MTEHRATRMSIQAEGPTGVGHAKRVLWRIDGDNPHYVVTSASVVLGEPETYVFAADETGAVTDWLELAGSFKGELDHEQAIDGYVDSLNEVSP